VVVFAVVDSYSILAPNAVPTGFVDGKVASEKVLAALNIGDNYRIGHTKVFFKAGILGQLEEMREEKLSSIFSNFQARIRGYLIRKNYTKLCDQRWGVSPVCTVLEFYPSIIYLSTARKHIKRENQLKTHTI